MACFHPLAATQLPGGDIIIHKKIHQAMNPQQTPAHLGRDIALPCGRCIGCKLDRATQWATRCLHESQLHEQTCALTLTYSDDANYQQYDDRPGSPTPRRVDDQEEARELSTDARKGQYATLAKIASVDNSRSNIRNVELSIRDHQLFIKRLRDKIKKPVRFYMCGEYGEKLQRPHYHYLVFGYDFPDKYYFKKSLSGTPLFRSAELEALWTEGHSWIGQVDYATCAYVASYVMKKMNGEKAKEHYRRTDEAGNDYWLKPEFNLMSRKPGIAREWWEQFNTDVTVIDGVMRYGTKIKPPRYYDKLLELMDPQLYETIKATRIANAETKKEDNTPARLEDKEIVQTALIKQKQRNFEK